MINALKQNWKVYAMEAVCLGLFMLSASFFAIILEFPGSIVHKAIPDDFTRLCIMGVAMGTTATLLIYSPMGRLSGAHMNPAVSFVFFRLGKMKGTDALYYCVFQTVGGIFAVSMIASVFSDMFADDHVNYVVTSPGKYGVLLAFIFEVLMSFAMMTMVLTTSNHPRVSPYTGIIAGIFVACFVILSAPVSGFSINPARTIASAIPAMQFRSFWIYMTAPLIGMFSAAELYKAFDGKTVCAKIDHKDSYLCIFNCGYCRHNSDDDLSKALSTHGEKTTSMVNKKVNRQLFL
jgi:aquaporin Z